MGIRCRELASQKRELEDEQRRLDHEFATLQGLMEEVKTSTSWRLTRPVRWLGRVLKSAGLTRTAPVRTVSPHPRVRCPKNMLPQDECFPACNPSLTEKAVPIVTRRDVDNRGAAAKRWKLSFGFSPVCGAGRPACHLAPPTFRAAGTAAPTIASPRIGWKAHSCFRSRKALSMYRSLFVAGFLRLPGCLALPGMA